MIRALNLMALVVAFVLSAALYVVKNDVKHAQARLINLQVQVSEAQEAMLLLEKEEAFLESPTRLARLAEVHLGMVPMVDAAKRSPGQVLSELKSSAPPLVSEVSIVAMTPDSQ